MKTRYAHNSLILTLIVIGLLFTLTRLKAQTLTTASFTYTVGSGGNVNFTSTNTTGLICTWRFGDGSLLSGNQTPSHTYSASGYYAVVLIMEDSFGVIRDSTTKAVLVNNVVTGLSQIDTSAKSELLIFPSPANHLLELIYTPFKETAPCITITDMSGKVMKSLIADYSGKCQIPTSDLPFGVYLVSLNSASSVLSKRVLIFGD